MLPCLNLALSDVMAHISQLERQTGIKEIAIVHMARPPTAAAPMFYSCLVGAAVQYSKHAYIR